MPRRRRNSPLRVFLNNELVGILVRETSGAITFQYDVNWITGPDAIPVSLSLPLREDAFRGEPVLAVFENLLPDSDGLRRLIAEKVGANGIDAYSLLARIGRDCVGALQFWPVDEEVPAPDSSLHGRPVNDDEIESLLENLGRAPLGLGEENDFRISVAGAQEKSALLWREGVWMKPAGTTPTTHILKPQIGVLPNGMDLSNSVENEFYCLRLLAAFGLPVAQAEIKKFGDRSTLVVTRFDRNWGSADRLRRLPQEDCCQTLSVPPTRKYQSQGGPGMKAVLELLNASDRPREDQTAFLKAQILFWLIGATDGHAKNFSLFLGPRGRFQMTPLYDVLSAQPAFKQRQVESKHYKMAMFVGENRHYQIGEIAGKHFVQTAQSARLPENVAEDALQFIATSAERAMTELENALPADFPAELHSTISAGLRDRLKRI